LGFIRPLIEEDSGLTSALQPLQAGEIPAQKTSDGSNIHEAIDTPKVQESPDKNDALAEDGSNDFETKVDVSVKSLNYNEMLTRAFNRSGSNQFDEDYEERDYYTNHIVKNIERRGQKLAARFRNNLNDEPSPESRRRKTERSILEPVDPKVRQQLFEWYHGKCQICNKTWPERSGSPFFIAGHLVEHKHASWLNNSANAISLCAEHFAQWRHASVEAPDIMEQIRTLRLQAEGGGGSLSIKVMLCGDNYLITYKEPHLFALKKLIEIAEE